MQVFYDVNTGEIKAVVNCQDGHAPPGDNVLEVDNCIPSLQYVKGGSLQQYTDEQVVLKRQRPSHWHEWTNITMSWVDKTPETLK